MAPAGSYQSCVVVGSTVHVGGHGPVNGAEMVCGKKPSLDVRELSVMRFREGEVDAEKNVI